MSEKYKIVRNYNYTISIIDRNGYELTFRDITGKDLEFLERFFGEQIELTFDNVIEILEFVNISKVNIRKLTQRVIREVFEIVIKEILCNFMPKFKWLEVCYGLQNNSFVAMDFFESQPMTKVMAMIQVHQNAIAEIKQSQSK
jgi:uncharacterized protein YfbU (UPF0304 family)